MEKVPYVELSDGDAKQTNAMYKCAVSGLCKDDAPTSSCQSWASHGYCDQHPANMLTWCKVTCNLCSSDSCIDNDGNCPAWKKSGACQTHPDVMKNHCLHSCNLCNAPPTQAPTPPTPPPHPPFLRKQLSQHTDPASTTRHRNPIYWKSHCTTNIRSIRKSYRSALCGQVEQMSQLFSFRLCVFRLGVENLP
ncbi:hypothetical protein OS493_027183 [Desmophyllum pertusum]|uniref:ShKT domain-containing protein n=1 Tax=Desmophyllum pertusum TaxID=174260 RepID=A0A9X0A1Y4_9CNID|nr:hypothetical protein OS493_027183 [Desmophyllum pertusum]